jgi:hypothetical protein
MAINLFFNPIRKNEKKLRAGFGFPVMGHPVRVSWVLSDTHHRQYRPAAFKFHAFYKKSGSGPRITKLTKQIVPHINSQRVNYLREPGKSLTPAKESG